MLNASGRAQATWASSAPGSRIHAPAALRTKAGPPADDLLVGEAEVQERAEAGHDPEEVPPHRCHSLARGQSRPVHHPGARSRDEMVRVGPEDSRVRGPMPPLGPAPAVVVWADLPAPQALQGTLPLPGSARSWPPRAAGDPGGGAAGARWPRTVPWRG